MPCHRLPPWIHSNHQSRTSNASNALVEKSANESNSDVLHPNRANVSKDELRDKISQLYKAGKDQVSVFGFRTQFGGGKSTGFGLIYDSAEAMKQFEPRYRLVRYDYATKIEKASRQQRVYSI
jgi:small subunit ribosomal protein S24e